MQSLNTATRDPNAQATNIPINLKFSWVCLKIIICAQNATNYSFNLKRNCLTKRIAIAVTDNDDDENSFIQKWLVFCVCVQDGGPIRINVARVAQI